MSLVVEGQTYKWDAGTLEELLALLAEAALSVRVEALHPERDEKIGELHVVAGGVSETIAGDRRGDAAMTYLRQIPGLRFLAHPTLPDPEEGNLGAPGPLEGSLATRPPPALMRYCENFVLTCALELRQGDDHVRVSYRRGEILRTLVNGSESGERLPEVMSWTEGTWRITLPQLTLPRPPKPTRPPRGGTSVDSSTIFGYQVQPPPAEVTATAAAPPPAAPATYQPTVPYSSSATLRRASDGATPMVETGGRAPAIAAGEGQTEPREGVAAKPESRREHRPEPATLEARREGKPDGKREKKPDGKLEEKADLAVDAQRAPTPRVPPPAAAPARTSRSSRGAGSFLASLLLHALLGVALGLAIVGGYWAFLRWGGALRLG
jgi:hypothetical protein